MNNATRRNEKINEKKIKELENSTRDVMKNIERKKSPRHIHSCLIVPLY